ncbi:hypothetical protein DFH08DRAFT_876614 [Mycena albidolilacea]|uniref:Uncharacterized protein n=1 Tax=Mycena albidolilacea TaxID=1033008 RepID=A0AAD6ZTJ6_9AGAR|nr:hypothetical protein DFH08DRAFT_876614 [Mycena albidolilacea]
MANAPVALGGPPQWATDQHNILLHTLHWNQDEARINHFNTQISLAKMSRWTAARTFNASCHHDSEPLQALDLLPVLIPMPVVPAPPAPGAALALPALFVAPPIILPAPPPNFPATKGALRNLQSNALAVLLAAYGQAVPVTHMLRRTAFASFVGVRL